MRRGSLTVFFSLILTIILSLVLTLVEGARAGAVRMRLEIVSDIAMNSVLAEYNRELLRQYDLLFVDTAYGDGAPDLGKTEQHLQSYLNRNLAAPEGLEAWGTRDFVSLSLAGADITDAAYASDGNGEVLLSQIRDYMDTTLVGMCESAIGDLLSDFVNSGIPDDPFTEIRNSNQAFLDGVEIPPQEVEPGVYEEVPLNNPADGINSIRGIGILRFVRGQNEISDVQVDLNQYISHREINEGSGLCDQEREVSIPCNDLQLHSYLLEKCGCFGDEKEDSLLQYEREYLIKGYDTDWKNLEEVCKTLVFWREVANCFYLFSDSEKIAEAEAMAAVLTAILLVPELLEPVKISILFAWAYLESLQDVRIMLNGGRVPLLKDASTWKTSLLSILNPAGSLSDEAGGEGLSYQDYLQIMLFLTPRSEKVWRLMDIIEMDVRKIPGYAGMMLDHCIHNYEATICVNSNFGGHAEITRRYGYYYYK